MNNITFKQYKDELTLIESVKDSVPLSTLNLEQDWSDPLTLNDLLKELGIDNDKL